MKVQRILTYEGERILTYEGERILTYEAKPALWGGVVTRRDRVRRSPPPLIWRAKPAPWGGVVTPNPRGQAGRAESGG